jgi:hypothetical protein
MMAVRTRPIKRAGFLQLAHWNNEGIVMVMIVWWLGL